MSDPTYKPTIVLDFDGVLHRYSNGWQGGELYDGPTDGCRAALERLAEMGRLVVSTARGGDSWTRDAVCAEHGAVWDWLDQHGLRDLIDDVTSLKPMGAVYIDDRAVLYEPGCWGDVVRTVAHRLDVSGFRPLNRALLVPLVRMKSGSYDTVKKGTIGYVEREVSAQYVWCSWAGLDGPSASGPINVADLEELGKISVTIPT